MFYRRPLTSTHNFPKLIRKENEMKRSAEPVTNPSSRLPGVLLWTGFLIVSAAALAVVFIPAWLIQPFKPQSQSALEISYLLRRWAPLATLIALTLAVAIAVVLWRRTRRWWIKPLFVIVLVLPAVSAWFARQNHFEWMFNPLPDPLYAKVGEADFVNHADMVIAVENNGESAAYPIRQMAYHHVVQDVVGGTPIVATY